MWDTEYFKTTLEIPHHIFRQATLRAAEQGITLRQFVIEAIEAKLASQEPSINNPENQHGDKPWMESCGKLSHLHEETMRIDRIIEEEFEQIEPEDLL